MTFLKSTVLAVFALVGLSLSAQAEQIYRVIGVALNDTLNMRADIPSSATIQEATVIAEIPPNAEVRGSGVMFEFQPGRFWQEVAFEGAVGWVNGSFLQLVDAGDLSTATIQCSGSEPGWLFNAAAAEAEFNDFIDPIRSLERLSAGTAQNRRDVLEAQYLSPTDSSLVSLVVVNGEYCTGPSPHVFPMIGVLLGISSNGSPLAGCCQFALE